MNRRDALKGLTAAAMGFVPRVARATPPTFRLATFRADVTVPVGHGMMGGAWRATGVADSLEARGLVLLTDAAPVVLVAVDWCEIRNDAYERWQVALAAAAGTTRERVLVMSVHQHDAPVADLTAERLLREAGRPGSVCDLEFHETAVRRVAEAVGAGLESQRRFTHIGTGRAKVERGVKPAVHRRRRSRAVRPHEPDDRPRGNRGPRFRLRISPRLQPPCGRGG
jgi:hypothetical protein